MAIDGFRERLLTHFDQFTRTLATDAGDWVVKGFIDVYRNIYTISVDTKVISKIIELMLLPVISQFAAEHSYKMVLSEYQNYYPDISFIAPDETKIALDLKSTYRTGAETVNGFTLGAFTGYFRQRKSTKNITFPYAQYARHFVLGVIYSRSKTAIDERCVYTLSSNNSWRIYACLHPNDSDARRSSCSLIDCQPNERTSPALSVYGIRTTQVEVTNP